jgi:hypothetical protein
MSLSSSLKGCEEIRLVALMNVEVAPATFTEQAVKEKVEGCFFSFEITENTTIVIALDFEFFFLLKMFLVFNLSMKRSQLNTFNLLAHFDSHSHMNGLGSCTLLKAKWCILEEEYFAVPHIYVHESSSWE